MEPTQKNYVRKRGEIEQVVEDIWLRGVSDIAINETGDLDDSDCYGFPAIPNKMWAVGNLELRTKRNTKKEN